MCNIYKIFNFIFYKKSENITECLREKKIVDSPLINNLYVNNENYNLPSYNEVIK